MFVMQVTVAIAALLSGADAFVTTRLAFDGKNEDDTSDELECSEDVPGQTSAPFNQTTPTPSKAPSSLPSNVQSVTPSTTPSTSPSVTSSVTPSAMPSNEQSATPSAEPSETPSKRPSTVPSSSPSSVPSIAPSTTPSTSPSVTPSATLSAMRRDSPTNEQSSAPTVYQNWRVNLKPLKASGMVPMTKDKLTLVQYAADMSLLSYEPEILADLFNDPRIVDNNVAYPESLMKYYESPFETFAMILDDREGYCTIAWRGTSMSNLDDWLAWLAQEFDMRPESVGPDEYGVGEDLDSRTCVVQKSFYDWYSGNEGGDDPLLEQIIKDFVEECMDNPDKQLVFTGHSQGGASAGVASIIFENFNPLAITFGQPPFLSSIMTGCELIVADHLWRFINSEDDELNMKYDLAPNIHALGGPMIGPHIGPSILLPPGSAEADLENHQTSVRYYPKTQPEIDLSIESFSLDGLVNAHNMGTDEIRSPGYKKKIDFLLEKLPDGEDLDISGFPKGDLCTHPEDCQTGRCDCDGNGNYCLRKTCLDKVGRF